VDFASAPAFSLAAAVALTPGLALARPALPVADGTRGAEAPLRSAALRRDADATPPPRAGDHALEADALFLIDELGSRCADLLRVKGVDWTAEMVSFRAEAAALRDDVELIRLCTRIVAKLRDGHARLDDVKVVMPDESAGRRFTGPHLHLVEIGESVFVRRAFADALRAGLKAGQEVRRIDDLPAKEWIARRAAELAETRGYSTWEAARYDAAHAGLAGWAGTNIMLEVDTGADQRGLLLTRSGGNNFVPIGPAVFPPDARQAGRQTFAKLGGEIGYIHLRDVPQNLPQQLDEMLAALGSMRGLILDMRANGGGECDHAAVFGRFIPAGESWRQYASAGANPFGGPMVVIVDAWCRSAGETIAGQFKEDGRAWMIGDAPTSGMSSQKERLEVPSGRFAVRFSVRSNKQRFNEGRGIEGIGVGPHEIVPYAPEDLRAGVDSLIRAGAERIARGLSRELVPWEARSP